jgi:hypothetical protein
MATDLFFYLLTDCIRRCGSGLMTHVPAPYYEQTLGPRMDSWLPTTRFLLFVYPSCCACVMSFLDPVVSLLVFVVELQITVS